ncbi:organic hydroperoxide resistance protein [Sinomicrobium sp. M5D2P17]
MMNTNIQEVLYTAKTHTIGGREGTSRSSDGRLNITLSTPGAKGNGTNPEQLFAAGWSACFLGALGHAARQQKLKLPEGTAIDTEVDLGTNDEGFQLRARLSVHLPGMNTKQAEELIAIAHQTCPYSKATRNNIEVTVQLASS